MRERTRNWMREKMKRRSKRGPNNSEATGKIGQEIPLDQPAALQPAYPEAPNQAHSEDVAEGTTLESAVASADGHIKDSSQAQSVGEESSAEPGLPAPGSVVLETQPESLSTPPAEAQPVGGSEGGKPAPKGYVVLAIGLPGSGKTTWYKRRGVTPLSSDMLRTILFDDITDQRYSGLVFSTLRSLLRARLIAKMPWNYVDATNLSAHERRQWIKMARSFGYEAQAVFFDVPLALCMERNSKRDRRVADDVMEKMAERLRPPSFREGFSKITVVRVKGHAGNTHAGAISPESFNAPVPDERGSVSLDEPSGKFSDESHAFKEAGAGGVHGTDSADSDRSEGREAVLADADGREGRASTLGHGETGEGTAEPSGRLATLTDESSPEMSGDQPDTYE